MNQNSLDIQFLPELDVRVGIDDADVAAGVLDADILIGIGVAVLIFMG